MSIVLMTLNDIELGSSSINTSLRYPDVGGNKLAPHLGYRTLDGAT
jgi:hypothetical protein